MNDYAETHFRRYYKIPVGPYLQILTQTFQSATEENNEGIANFIAERMDAHNKHAWMLRSFLKGSRA